MDEINIIKAHDAIQQSLDKRSLRDALDSLKNILDMHPDSQLLGKLEEVRTTYEYMLKYMLEGVEDPDRMKVYDKLLDTAYYLNDRLRINRLAPLSTRYYYDRLRFYQLVPARSISDLQLDLEAFMGNLADRKRHEEAAAELFYRTWLSVRWTEKEEKEAKELLQSVLVPENDLALFVSALTLSLTVSFDIRKFMLLLDAYEQPSLQVNQRALVGIAFLVMLYDPRLAIYPEINARIQLLNENPSFGKNLATIQIQLLRTRETQKIDRKMREEIIPEVMRNMNQLNPKLGIEETDEESFSEDRNPDWADSRSKLNDKLKEMSELQMEGADVYMTTFAQLKSFPFFREFSNWFLPFDPNHSAIIQSVGQQSLQKSLLGNMLQSGFFCNSDKYSFCFTLTQIPENQREMMAQQLEEQYSGEKEALKESLADPRPEIVSNQYIHDLYRFYKLYPRRHEYRDLFNESFDLHNTTTLFEVLNNVSHLKDVAEYLFQKNYFSDAYFIYRDIEDKSGADAEMYEKMGYCCQKEKLYEEAIHYYKQADLLKPDNVWINRHVAICYRQSRQYEKAVEYYKKVESVEPENLNLLIQIGHCYAELKQYNEALSYFFKVDYLKPDQIKIWRAIAWCSFLSGKEEQAVKFYEKILGSSRPEVQDYLNAGHVQWIKGNLKETARLYRQGLSLSASRAEFISLLWKDASELENQGISKMDMKWMADAL